jgi:hypothetical protein
MPCLLIQGLHALFSDLSLQLHSVLVKVAVQVGIASMALPMHIVLIVLKNRVMACAVKVPRVHLGHWLQLPTRDTDKGSLDLPAIPPPDESIEMLGGEFFEGRMGL